MKRGQVTAFIIIGIIILIGVGLLIYLTARTQEEIVQQEGEETIATGAIPVKDYIDNCMNRAAEDAVVHVSLRGGYYEVIGAHASFGDIDIPYYFYEGQKNMPAREDIQKELVLAFENYVGQCLLGLETFMEQGYQFNEKGEETVTAAIVENNVFFEVIVPLEIVKDEDTFRYDRFSGNAKLPLDKMIGLTEQFAVFQAENPNALRMAHLIDLSLENGIKTEIIRQSEGEVIFYMIDDNTVAGGKPYGFAFAVKYTGEVE